MENLNLLLNLKDATKTLLNQSSEKMENFIKSIRNQLDTMDMGMKIYLKTMIEVASKNNKNELDIIESKIGSAKIENHRYAYDLKNLANDLKVEREEVMNIKKDVVEKINISYKNYDDFNSKMKENFFKLSSEHDSMKIKFNELAEFIKVLNNL